MARILPIDHGKQKDAEESFYGWRGWIWPQPAVHIALPIAHQVDVGVATSFAAFSSREYFGRA